MAVLQLNHGQSVIVDDDNYDFLMQWNWFVRSGYASRLQRSIENGVRKRKTIFMHRIINKTPKGMQTDHINGNRLDNRKENLRSVSHKQNQQNKKVSKHSTSGFKGVGKCKQTGKWRVSLTIDKKFINLGRYDCLGVAAKVYNLAAKNYHGEFARLNKI